MLIIDGVWFVTTPACFPEQRRLIYSYPSEVWENHVRDDRPHRCPRCNSRAMIVFQFVHCENPVCVCYSED